jgi:hypothetical protein
MWQESRQIIPARFGKIEKLRGHHDADRVTTNVVLSCVAAAATSARGILYRCGRFSAMTSHGLHATTPDFILVRPFDGYRLAAWLKSIEQ